MRVRRNTARWLATLCLAMSCACGDDDAQSTEDAGLHDAADSMDAAANADANTRPASSFELLDSTPEECPLSSSACKSLWPSAELGTMTKLTSRETYGGKTWERTFHVYRPNRVLDEPHPLVIFLHGGGGNGLQRLDLRFQVLADDRGSKEGVSWRENTKDCQYAQLVGFRSVPEGKPCSPDPVTFQNALPFTLVLPDGILDVGSDVARHWEDGRVPSPGQRTVEEQRNDVGFIDHILDVLLTEQADSIDAERMYVMGNSNGGMMTQRVACNVTSETYPHVQRLAAFAASVATMPAGIADGTDGRERCPERGDALVPIAYFVGYGIDTPNCDDSGCASEAVSGDGVMPYGETGGRYNVFAAERGLVIAAEDAHAHWIDYNELSGAGAPSTAVEDVGFFTESRTTTYESSDVRVHVLAADGGTHSTLGSRMDAHAPARMWQFVSSFRRNESGDVVYSEPTHLTGTF